MDLEIANSIKKVFFLKNKNRNANEGDEKKETEKEVVAANLRNRKGKMEKI